MARLPEFCQDTLSFEPNGSPDGPTPRQRRWVSQMGKAFWAMHHYCWALIHVNRSQMAGLPLHVRKHMWNTAIADQYYVVRYAQPDFVLLPELFYRIGSTHVLLQEYAQTISAFDRSRALKPDYWPPYVGHAGVLETLGKNLEAKKILESGLQQMPGEPTLIRQYTRLGGQLDKLPSTHRTPKAAAPMSSAASDPRQ